MTTNLRLCPMILLVGVAVSSLSPALAQVPATDALPVLPTVTLPQQPTAVATPPVIRQDGIPALPADANSAATNGVTPPGGTAANAGGPAPQETIRYSYGDLDIGSLFYGPAEIKAMKETLRTWENRRDAPVLVEEALPEEVVPAVPPDAKTYPVFHLSSIVYRNAGDWAVWVNGDKITPKKNTTDVKVLSVSASQASFSWTPSYSAAVTLRQEKKLFAATDPVKHRLTTASALRYDPLMGTAFFSLKPNQSFAAGYMNIFEGSVESPSLAVIDPNVLASMPMPSTTPPPLPAPAAPSAAEPVPATPAAAPPVASEVSVDKATQVVAPAEPAAPAPAAPPAPASKVPTPSAASETLGELPATPAP